MVNLYDVLVVKVQESAYYWKLAMKLLNVFSIIYGLNIQQALNALLSFRGFRSNHRVLCRRFVLLVTLVGFSLQTVQIFQGIIQGRHVATGMYLDSEDLLLPDFVFCVDYRDLLPDRMLDEENHQLTGTYLNDSTSSFTISSLVERLVYLNEKNEFTDFKDRDDEKEVINFKTTFFRDWKCLEISVKITYKPRDVYCLSDPYLLKFYLNRSLLPDHFYFGFMEQGSFGRIAKLSSKRAVNRKVRVELYKQVYGEKFRLLKHPLAWFYERFYGLTEITERGSYLNQLRKNFKRNYNLTTKLITLEGEHFDTEISDQLFFQFYSQVQRQIDRMALPNFFSQFEGSEFLFIDRMLEGDRHSTELPDFEVSSQFFYFVTILSNADNFINFVQNLLNVLAFYFGTSLIDLGDALDRLGHFLVSAVSWLRRARTYFVRNLQIL